MTKCGKKCEAKCEAKCEIKLMTILTQSDASGVSGRIQTSDQVVSRVWRQVSDQVWIQVYDQVQNQVWRQVGDRIIGEQLTSNLNENE